jgi:alkanesulfonate monooxygenase SsuD/methylene tetrahydromethanopterin reductase-like flavin-dependent oxidoreductase (luciferase family)
MLIEQIVHAEEVGLELCGVGEYHRREFLDSAPAVILGAAAVRTQRIRLATTAASSCGTHADVSPVAR